MTRGDVLRKCIVVFDAIRRMASKGNAGLEAAEGAEESFRMDTEICDTLREMLREMEYSGNYEAVKKVADWQKDIMENGIPERLDFKEKPEERVKPENYGQRVEWT